METQEENLRLVSDFEQIRIRVKTTMIQTQHYVFDLFWGHYLEKSAPVKILLALRRTQKVKLRHGTVDRIRNEDTRRGLGSGQMFSSSSDARMRSFGCVQRNDGENFSGRALRLEVTGRRSEGKRRYVDVAKEEVKWVV